MAGCCPPDSWPACQKPDDYKPKGTETKIGELPVYSVGTGDKAILVLPDIFGWSSNQGRLMGIADTLADQGYRVLLSDPFYGDSAVGKEDIMGWITQFPFEKKIGADIEACVKHLQDQGCSSVGAVGFCWGVWAFCKSASMGVPLKCGVGPHPSTRLEGAFGGDEQAMMDKVNMPVLIMPAGNDPENLKEGGAIAESLAKKGGKSVTFPDMQHGWCCRGDLGQAEVKRDVEAAMKHMVDFFKSNLCWHCKDCFQPWKDLVVPPLTPLTGARSLMAKSKPFFQRKFLMTWRGQHAESGLPEVRKAYLVTNETVRTALIHNLSHLPRVSIGSPVSGYADLMGNSKFCLCPKGASSYTSRLFEALFAGCIPVILSDHLRLPFDHVVNWSEFSIHWPMEEADLSLYRYLQGRLEHDAAGIMNLQRRGGELRCWFDYFSQEEVGGSGRPESSGINGLPAAVRFFEDPQKCSPYAALLRGLGQRVAGLTFCMLTASARGHCLAASGGKHAAASPGSEKRADSEQRREKGNYCRDAPSQSCRSILSDRVVRRAPKRDSCPRPATQQALEG
ncbi:unnamed protein product [Symbiodinium sp. CCMP2456]|nr:unnamed protein product [Symbiodinium sp. CCMP2456]